MAEQIRRDVVIGGNADKAVKAIQGLIKAEESLETKLKRAEKAAIEAFEVNTPKALEAAKRAVMDYERALDSASKDRGFGRDQVGDVSTFLSGAGSLAGGGALSEALSFGADASGALEYVGNFKNAVKLAGEAALNAGGVVGAFANAGASVASVIPGVSASMGALTAVALPVAGVVLAAVSAIDTYNRSLEASRNALSGALEGQKRYYDLLVDGTSEEAQEQVKRANRENDQLRARQLEILVAQQKAFEATANGQGEAAARILTAVADVTGQFGDLDSELKAIGQQLQSNETFTKRATQGIENNAFAANDAAVELEQLAQQEQQLTTQRQSAIDAIQTLNDREKELNAQFNTQQLQSFQDRLISSKRSSEDLTIQETRAAEDLARQLEQNEDAHQDRLLDITERGNDAVEQANKQLADAEAKANADRLEASEDAAKSLAEAESNYQRDALKLQEEFARNRRKIEEDANEARNQAIADNDVRAFIDANNEEKKALKDLREQRREDKGDLKQQLEEERQKVAQNFAERLTQIDAEIQKQREATALRIAEINTQTQAALESERLTYSERLRLDAESRAITEQREIEDRARRDARAAEDTQRQYDRQAALHQQQIDNLNSLETRELERYYALDTALQGLVDKSAMLQTTINGGTSTAISPITPPPVLPPPTTSNSAFAGAQASVSGSQPAGDTINATFIVSDIATKRDIDAALVEFQQMRRDAAYARRNGNL